MPLNDSGPMTWRTSREFVLVLACCRWPCNDAAIVAVRDVAGGVDWSRVFAITRRHRVSGLVHNALEKAGVAPSADIAAALAGAARQIAMRGLRLAAEMRRIGEMADRTGLTFLILKGAPLAQLAYGMQGIKHASDIDIAVMPGDVAPMEAILSGAGYRPFGDATPKHTAWRHRERKSLVELHTALVDHPSWLMGVSAESPAQRVAIGNAATVPTLAPDPLFAYLCVHGATHGWSRLKWLADVAALLSDIPPADIERLHRHADEMGAGRCAAQALLLCADLLGTQLDPAHEMTLRRSLTNRWLVRAARKSMIGANEIAELDESVLATIPIHLSHLMFDDRWRARIAVLSRKLGGGADETDPPFIGAPRRVSQWLARRGKRKRPERQPGRDPE